MKQTPMFSSEKESLSILRHQKPLFNVVNNFIIYLRLQLCNYGTLNFGILRMDIYIDTIVFS